MKTTKKIAYKTVKVWELDTLSFFFFRNSNNNFTDFYVINLFSPSTFPLTILSYFSKMVGV